MMINFCFYHDDKKNNMQKYVKNCNYFDYRIMNIKKNVNCWSTLDGGSNNFLKESVFQNRFFTNGYPNNDYLN